MRIGQLDSSTGSLLDLVVRASYRLQFRKRLTTP